MQRRQTRFGCGRSFRHSELGTGTQIRRGKPFRNEVIRKAKFIPTIIIVQTGIPERIRNRSLVVILRNIQILVYSAIGIVLAVIGISQSIFGERDHWVGRFQIINRQFVTELELPGTINQIQITG